MCSNNINLKEKKKKTKSLNSGETNQDMKFMETDALILLSILKCNA